MKSNRLPWWDRPRTLRRESAVAMIASSTSQSLPARLASASQPTLPLACRNRIFYTTRPLTQHTRSKSGPTDGTATAADETSPRARPCRNLHMRMVSANHETRHSSSGNQQHRQTRQKIFLIAFQHHSSGKPALISPANCTAPH